MESHLSHHGGDVTVYCLRIGESAALHCSHVSCCVEGEDTERVLVGAVRTEGSLAARSVAKYIYFQATTLTTDAPTAWLLTR